MRQLTLILVVLVVVVIVGCGGGDSVGTTPEGQGGSVTGQLEGTVDPQSFNIYVDGQKTATTPDANGNFRLSNLPPGAHVVSVISESGLEGVYVEVELNEGENEDLGPIRPILGGQIVGLVMALDSSGTIKPLPGVVVLADPQPPVIILPQPPSQPLPARDADRVPYRAVTDERGSYVIPAVKPGVYLVTVNMVGMKSAAQWVLVEAGRTVVADFLLEPLVPPGVGRVTGTVLGLTNGGRMPLVGAVVTIWPSQPWDAPSPGPVPMPDNVANQLPATLDQSGASADPESGIYPPPYRYRLFRTLTDAQGHYSLNVPSGELVIEVWKEGYWWQSRRLLLLPGGELVENFLLQPLPPRPWPGPPMDDTDADNSQSP